MQAALPAYEIGAKLGQGAFGVVYEAVHSKLGRKVAIKQLPQSFAENDEVRERFVAEAQMVASLEHPHIVPVYDFVESEGSRFLIMERCAGSVGDRFKEDGLVTDEACAAVLACLGALDFAHDKGLLHRDVKPENLMYDTKGVVKLADFGIARDLGSDTRRTATGMIIGTPAYMSPEQCRGDELTPASDVYSVAMMAYELLTGGLPFPKTDSINGLLAHHLVTEPTPLLMTRPELPGAVGEVIDQALVKDLSVRYSTAEQFATALARACVTAFGSGWLRRRRFVLHWPEIIAETERPDSNSPRTGTIMVKAGDLPQTAAPAVPTPPAPLAPQPVAVVDANPNANAPTEVEPAAPPAPPANTSPPVITGDHPTSTSFGADEPPEPGSSPNWKVLGAVAAAIAAIVIGVLTLTGGGSDTTTATAPETEPTQVAEATEPESTQDSNEPSEEAPTVAVEEPTAAPQPTEAAEPTPAPEPTPDPEPTAAPLTKTGQAEQPFVMGSNGNPIMNRLPLDFNDRVVDSPWAPSPCPVDQPLVGCIFAVVDATEPDDDNLSVPFFSLGFTPELEPAGHHLHFYIPELVGGDETKAGTATPGGAWRVWDGPCPAPSFGGDSGRTLYTMADFRSAGSTTLCVIVANAEHEAIPGSGNCAPVVSDADADLEKYQFMVERLEGKWAGACADRVMAIVPQDWRVYNLNRRTPAEIAAEIRPTAVADTTALLQTFQDQGGALWVEGPALEDFIVNLSFSTLPGGFTLNDTPREVADTLSQLGLPTSGGGARQANGRNLYFEVTNNGPSSSSATFVIPDHGYATVMTLTAPPGSGFNELADQIAYTVQGC